LKQKIAIISPVPSMIESVIESSMIRKAVDNGILDIHIVNPRDFSKGSYQQIDDTPFGGGPGMVMMAEPLFKAIDFVIDKFSGEEGMRILYPSPQGTPWSQSSAEENKDIDKIVIICGHYKGVDQRVIDRYVTHEYSMGDFVLSCGELPALMIVDSIVRLLPGVLNDINSSRTDTFSSDLLDSPHYTQPREIRNMHVPDVLLSGNHKKIKNWKKDIQIETTKIKRPDIWKKYINNKSE
jgi:tRNA (guanine37-N1)-methyltransferase